MSFDKVKQAIEDLKNGKMIVMVDDEDRENEGDLIFAADKSDMQKVNFAITHAKGVLCLAMDEANAKRLDLPLMVAKNTSSHETAFTITIDAKDATTGVSAYERDMSIRLAADADSKPDDFVRPGHIFPLIAKNGGVLVRTGHTEGSVDLCRLAGLSPMAAICEIVKEDGMMARRDDLEEFCEKFKINMLSVSDLVQYRLHSESLIKVSEPIQCQIAQKNVVRYDIIDHENEKHAVYAFGEIAQNTNVKFVKSIADFDFISSAKFDELISAIEFLKANGGLLIFLSSKTNDSNSKDFGIGAQILKHFGVKKIEVLSHNKKDFVGISGFGLDITGYKEI
ncbi:bifunctional 3,4-dihydroxy-2-butanone 4-phosphate synthase/GTP cyclohydrolase II [Campylobacter sp. RM9344]|uniref:3,4-dihydroxy-2-butanone 4-phosphate synthase n=1 Tax=Campylobacter californiensis TaxID=1032243 RepID=A0AAW3ZVC1_9BACT|nr:MULTISPECIES: bifunctional 3,4-dihydroxy-2-butanone 4-phosphate synthase/GTP cyclohydrolase II [unclassified Campylobacter]MBE2985288.1 bifunctional 3,4-dihydroxy-2-butanone 4-phosphate synthase/GTP cyclohydrolase II [Campylobacter sp. RM6883]MBE2987126.1 bifunctional 3,4-dihydroxy-2-butanone 4-phosphate synthase/GTP cyclohydrolase II [Campylobacter sp. RM12919]MBE2989031.1 bifunctional 3,4-dihydroxy-2-butanone 4-phosphate synthase/GTP cyclohydrolase II [Campylobacter sp. RM12920]MBE2995929.